MKAFGLEIKKAEKAPSAREWWTPREVNVALTRLYVLEGTAARQGFWEVVRASLPDIGDSNIMVRRTDTRFLIREVL